MKLISLSCIEPGYACGTSTFINNHYYKNKKNRDFFDLITCSMLSVNQVLLNQKKYSFKERTRKTSDSFISQPYDVLHKIDNITGNRI